MDSIPNRGIHLPKIKMIYLPCLLAHSIRKIALELVGLVETDLYDLVEYHFKYFGRAIPAGPLKESSEFQFPITGTCR